MTDELEASATWWVNAQRGGEREAFYRALDRRRVEKALERRGPAMDAPWPWSKRSVARVTEKIQGIR